MSAVTTVGVWIRASKMAKEPSGIQTSPSRTNVGGACPPCPISPPERQVLDTATSGTLGSYFFPAVATKVRSSFCPRYWNSPSLASQHPVHLGPVIIISPHIAVIIDSSHNLNAEMEMEGGMWVKGSGGTMCPLTVRAVMEESMWKAIHWSIFDKEESK